MSGIIHTAPRRHHCRPGWTEYVIQDPDIPELNGRTGLSPPSTGIPDGSVWECDCGKTWVAYRPYPHVLSPKFRAESLIHRWLRERRERS